jgi:hypothetical protein
MDLKDRIGRHLVRSVLLVGGSAVTGGAHAEIVYSGVVNIPIPLNIDGVYLNVVTGATGSAGAAVAGWDINPYSATALTWFVPSAPAASHGLVRGLGNSTTQVDNLFGSSYLIAATGTPAPNYGTGTNQTTGDTAFIFNSANNIVGFRFFNESTGQINHGWMRLSLSGAFNTTRSIVEYAYENNGTGIVAGTLPFPAVSVLMNPAFVQTCGGFDCEGTNTANMLTALGVNVSTITDLTPASIAAAFAGGRVLVIPEQEVGSLYASMSPATRDAFRNAVLAGGRVLVFGTGSNRASEIVNLLLSSSTAYTGTLLGSTATVNTASVAGTPFATGPVSVIAPDATFVTGPWPSASIIPYGTSNSAWVAAASSGSGRVGFIAYDYFNPAGQSAASAWNTVVDRMLRYLGPSVVPPPDADGDGVPDSADNCPAVANANQADCDGDSLGDACETDPDANLNGIRDNCESGTLVFAVPQHFATVASAVAAATPNSIVRVGPGTYTGRIDFAGKAITVESTAGAAATVLDGGGQPGSIVSFLSGEGPGSVLRGFTIRNGVGGTVLPQAPWQYTVGGGIHINLSSPTVEDCVVENCSAPWGGGIMAGFGWATITGSELDANTAGGTGSALRWRYADPEPTEPPFLTVEGCVIRDNLSTGGGGAAIAALPVPATISLENLEFCRNSPENLEGAFLDLGGSFTCGCPADVNLDHEVGAEDLATVIGFWGPCAAPCAADLDDNGVVDANDLAVVIGGWGACP